MTGLHEECGVFGVYAPHTTDVAAMTYAALYALQHRGQESCGIVVNDRGVFAHHKDLGLVPEVFQAEDMEKLGHGNISIGHGSVFHNRKTEPCKCTADCGTAREGFDVHCPQRESYQF